MVTGYFPVENKLLRLAAVKEFENADEDFSETLDCEEILHWIEKSEELEIFLKTFEPKVKIYNEPWVFLDFPEMDF